MMVRVVKDRTTNSYLLVMSIVIFIVGLWVFLSGEWWGLNWALFSIITIIPVFDSVKVEK